LHSCARSSRIVCAGSKLLDWNATIIVKPALAADQQAAPSLDALIVALNAPQRQAVLAPPGPVLVCAGPGSGKTRVLTLRAAALIAHYGVAPNAIVAVTFTNRAARELRERLALLLDPQAAAQLQVGTFHSLCARWLRRAITRLGRAPNFTIYDEDDTAQLLKRTLADAEVQARLADLGLRSADLTLDKIGWQIGAAKAQQLGPRALLAAAERERSRERLGMGIVYEAYQARLKAANALDFDDLLFALVGILERYPEALAELRAHYEHVLVDEVQDTARIQLRLLELLCAEHRCLFAVGDRAQSLYSWRWALPTLFDELLQTYPQAALIKLEQNYRSTPEICAAAQALIDASHEQSPFTTRIWTARPVGAPVLVGAFRSEIDEARSVADEIGRLVGAGACSLGDVAVIVRTNAQLRPVEDALLRAGLPYNLIGGVPFYERAEIKDLLALLRVLANPADELSMLRMLNVPRRGVGDATRDALLGYAREQGCSLHDALVVAASKQALPLTTGGRRGVASFVALLDELREAAQRLALPQLIGLLTSRIGYKVYLQKEHGVIEGADRWANVMQLLDIAERWTGVAAAALDDFLAEATLMSDEDLVAEANGGRITCVTAYKAKGLEWPVVFAVGLNEGLLPHQRSIDARARRLIEEERRVCYVALTRARDRLYLSSFAYRTNTGGPPQRCQPSRFLADIPQHLWAAWGE
jgi:DNA helicase II / ATP-dependent DNA helicase PcrA